MNFSKKNLFQDWEDGFSLKCFACVSPEWTYQFSQLKVKTKNKIRDLSKVKLYAFKKERRGDKHMLTQALTGGGGVINDPN